MHVIANKHFSVQFSYSADSLWPHGLQHARLSCPSPSPGACSNSFPLNGWCHPTISSCHPPFLLPSVFPSIRVFSNELALCIRWPKYWSFSFSISPSNEFQVWFLLGLTGLTSCCPRESQESSPTPQFESINSLVLSLLYGPTFTTGKTIALTVQVFVD